MTINPLEIYFSTLLNQYKNISNMYIIPDNGCGTQHHNNNDNINIVRQLKYENVTSRRRKKIALYYQRWSCTAKVDETKSLRSDTSLSVPIRRISKNFDILSDISSLLEDEGEERR